MFDEIDEVIDLYSVLNYRQGLLGSVPAIVVRWEIIRDRLVALVLAEATSVVVPVPPLYYIFSLFLNKTQTFLIVIGCRKRAHVT